MEKQKSTDSVHEAWCNHLINRKQHTHIVYMTVIDPFDGLPGPGPIRYEYESPLHEESSFDGVRNVLSTALNMNAISMKLIEMGKGSRSITEWKKG